MGEEKQRESAHVPGAHKWALHVSGDKVYFFLLPVKHLHKYKMQRVGGRAREAYYKVKFLRQVTAFLFTSKFTEFTCSNYCADMV